MPHSAQKSSASINGRSTFYRLRLPANLAVETALQRLSALADVETSEPNYIYRATAVPNDPFFDRLWGLNNPTEDELDFDINAPEGWETSTGDSNVIIGVIDTGIDYDHEDLAANVWRNPGEIQGNGIDDDQNGYVDDYFGYDVVNGDPDPRDDDGHGTHVSGTIAASGNNGIGTVGVMWQASIVSCKFLDSNGFGTTADAISCLNYFNDLKDSGVDVVATNNSWGGTSRSVLLESAIADHRDRDILFVAAAGNDGLDTDVSPHFPASYTTTNIVSVASMDSDGDFSSFSNFGATSVDIVAPGRAVWSTVLNNGYDRFRGTSMAAPHVTGIIGLIKSTDPQLTGTEIQNWLLSNGTQYEDFIGKTVTGAFARAELPPLDRDSDGMEDRWEEQFGLNPDDPADAALDNDSDGLSNLEEFQEDTNPIDPDSDGDGLSDGDEVNTYLTDPLRTDSDGDGLDDFDEVNQYFTNPADADSDGDGLSDFDELINLGTNPIDADSDADGLGDGWEVEFGFDPLNAGEQSQDSDG